MSTEFFVAPPFNMMDVDISHDADWLDPFTVVEGDGTTPVDLTGALLELYIRPRYAHSTLLKKLSSGAGIVIEDAAQGMAYFSLDRAVIQADLPVGEWQQFMVLTEGSTQTELWRGQCRVHPSKVS